MTNRTSEQRAALKAIKKAIKTAGRKLPLKSEKARNEMLAFAADDMAEAYQIGVEEAQREIVYRLRQIQAQLVAPPATEVRDSPSFSPNFDERNGIT